MAARSGYFNAVDGKPLYFVFHEPTSVTRTAILMVPPLFEERKSSYRVLGQLASALASLGHPVFRFDFRGCGESGGDAALHWSELQDDLVSAFEFLKSNSSSSAPILVGLRMGATLCHEVAEALKPRAMVSMAPVVNGKRQVRHWRLRGKMQSEWGGAEQIDKKANASLVELAVDGYEIATSFLKDCERLDLLKCAGGFNAPTLLLEVGHRGALGKDMQALHDSIGSNCVSQGIRLEPFWERIDDVDPRLVFDAVTKFLTDLESSTDAK